MNVLASATDALSSLSWQYKKENCGLDITVDYNKDAEVKRALSLGICLLLYFVNSSISDEPSAKRVKADPKNHVSIEASKRGLEWSEKVLRHLRIYFELNLHQENRVATF